MTNDTQLSLRDTTLKAISFHGREMWIKKGAQKVESAQMKL
jgi:hypothetical protein